MSDKNASNDLATLVSKYPAACKNSDKMRGWKRSLTLFIRNQVATGRQESRILAGVKRSLTCAGLDTSHLS